MNSDAQHETHWISVGRGGLIAAHRVIAVARAGSAPIKRLLVSAGPARIVNLTYGEPRQAVLILSDGFLAVVSLSVEEVEEALRHAYFEPSIAADPSYAAK